MYYVHKIHIEKVSSSLIQLPSNIGPNPNKSGFILNHKLLHQIFQTPDLEFDLLGLPEVVENRNSYIDAGHLSNALTTDPVVSFKKKWPVCIIRQ